MVKSMNAAVAGLRTHQTRMDVISNNIANINTWGYKARTANFQDSLYTNLVTSSQGKATAGNTGGVNASQIGYGSGVGSISSNFTTGSGQYTGNSLDCMINGPAFFIVGPYMDEIDADNNGGVAIGDKSNIVIEDEALDEKGALKGQVLDVGQTSLSLSRVGIFTVDSNGFLVDANGNYVYGYAYNHEYDPDAETPGAPILYTDPGLVPIRIPVMNEDGEKEAYSTDTSKECFKMTTYTVSPDGTIAAVDRDNKRHIVGQIAVVLVENPNGLEQNNGYLFTSGDNAGEVYLTTSNEATGKIQSNYLEMSNVDLAYEISLMITGQRGYQANTKMITVTDQMLEELVNMKR